MNRVGVRIQSFLELAQRGSWENTPAPIGGGGPGAGAREVSGSAAVRSREIIGPETLVLQQSTSHPSAP